ncbi:MAG: cation:proton antiporter [Cellulomonas sp.]|uniref:cation:proton antiporter domain-containing protein n=1 Tax=Cellulomonas sp. TaxID=40001 RepID=UPI0019F1C4CB|nr:cation:proton antiporter [Cellulomonas sp.]MBF0688231.1 cation:proton antiporter [Cellulomonas sp.]
MTGLVLVVVCAAVAGRVARHLRQPPVVGVMLLGLLLGPLALGSVAPGVVAGLWPPSGAPLRAGVAEVGTVALVALLGLHLDAGGVVRRGSAAVVTLLGGVAALAAAAVLTVLRVLLGQDVDVPTSVAVTACALGTSALPVLGEIVRSRGLTDTPEARLALASAALLDGAVWLVLGVVAVSSAHSSGRTGVGAVLALAGLVAGGLVAARCARPCLARVRPGAAGAVLVLVALAAATAGFAALGRAAGTHGVVGAFVLGAAVPWDALPEPVRRVLAGPVRSVVTHALLPVCFLVAGLAARPVVASVQSVVLVVAVVALAVAVKVAGVRMSVGAGAVPPEQAARLTALLNTRGVTEVLVIEAARGAGLLDGATATAFLVAAVVTTAVTGPWLTRIERSEARKPQHAARDASS